MNMFARFDENPAMTLRVIKETKRYGRTHGRTDARTDNVKTVYPYKQVCGGYNKMVVIRAGPFSRPFFGSQLVFEILEHLP